MMVGTSMSAANSALSLSALSTLMPARSNSLFLQGRAYVARRCFRASITTYSVLGMVKLSRTSLALVLPVKSAALDGEVRVFFGAAGLVAAFFTAGRSGVDAAGFLTEVLDTELETLGFRVGIERSLSVVNGINSMCRYKPKNNSWQPSLYAALQQ